MEYQHLIKTFPKINSRPVLLHTDRMSFTFGRSGIVVYPPRATFGPRMLQDFEFVWIIDGDVVWNVDGQQIAAPPGTVLLGRPGQRDGFRWDPVRRTRHGFFHFQIHVNGAKLPPADHWPLSRLLPANDIIRPLFLHLGWLLGCEDDATREQAREQAQGIMRQALVAYLTGLVGASDEVDRDRHPLVERALEYVHEQWADGEIVPITLGDLARAAGVSKPYLTRAFQATFDVPPIAVLRHLRLDRAMLLLARTNLPIQEVSEATGFPNPFHFSKVFRTVYGTSPREFRAGIERGDVPKVNRLTRTRRWADRMWR